MTFRTALSVAWIGLALLAAPAARVRAAEAEADGRLAAADKFVLKSDRYLHQSKLARGMKGYGLTVLSGTEIVRFDVEIISVMKRWGMHQDVILARLSGQGLEKTGIIAGMSGSPVFVRDGGKDKMIGAVAYGFQAQKEPVCGIQPIAQMLAATDLVGPGDGQAGPRRSGGSMPATASPTWWKQLLRPGRLDAAKLLASEDGDAQAGRLVPLATPLMISRLYGRSLADVQQAFSPMHFVPVAAGGVGGRDAPAAGDVRIEPGAAISVPLVAGDADWYAVGTVTDVIGDRVLAFGHDFLAEGDVEFPLAAAYVHVVIAGLIDSFKLTSTLGQVGALERDETVGIFGRLGAKASMIPMELTVRWPEEDRRQQFHFQLCRHPWLTALMFNLLVRDGVVGWRKPPEYHTIRHTVEIDFGKLGRFRASNVSTASSVAAAQSDGLRPLVALLHNPFGAPPRVEGIAVDVEVRSGDARAEVLDLKLDGEVYRPGDAVTGTVTLAPFRQARVAMPVRFELPADLEEGDYTLTACDDVAAMRQFQAEMPQRFDPRNVEQLFDALQRVVSLPADQLYLRLPLQRGGVALRQSELRDLPGSKAGMLAEAEPLNAHPFRQSLVRGAATPYVLSGEASASFQVRKRPQETPVHP